MCQTNHSSCFDMKFQMIITIWFSSYGDLQMKKCFWMLEIASVFMQNLISVSGHYKLQTKSGTLEFIFSIADKRYNPQAFMIHLGLKLQNSI